ncbi:MAG: cytochrome b561/polyisoprenoid-binding protein YceI [Arenicella sp.]|jgi:cytochrome b561/polyisoprenoid-binding protein YceI
MKHYSMVAKVLHWSVAGLIVGQYVLAKLAENAKHEDKILEQLALLANHKSIGITILVLAVIRLLYRLRMPAPSLPSSMAKWQVTASKLSHVLLYGFLFALPISGWLMSSAKAYSVSWFNLIALPDFVMPSKPLAEFLHVTHHYLAEALFVIALLHILAALKHHFIDKDDVLNRISSKFSWLLFVLVILLVIGLFGRLFNVKTLNSHQPQAEQAQLVDELTNSVATASELPLWEIDYQQSFIKFKGDQAGAVFEGQWQRWSAEVQFDAKQLDKARFNVVIDTDSGFSNDQERDDTIRSVDFFDIASFPQANYRADKFTATGSDYQSIGKLSMKAISADTILKFSVVDDGKFKILTGRAVLDRLTWDIGVGDWADTTWVGQRVTVEVRVVAKP